MLTFEVVADKTLRDLQGYGQDQVPYAMARAMTKTAQDVRTAEREQMVSVFDRPTPYTLRGLRIWAARKNALIARVGFIDDGSSRSAGKYLQYQIFGGHRKTKGFERALYNAGVMPEGWVAVPGKGARLDRYGNISGAQIVQILSAFRTFTADGFAMNRTTRSIKERGEKLRDFFVSGPVVAAKAPNGGRLPFGVWERRSRKGSRGRIVNILMFVPEAKYDKRLKFYETARATVQDRWSTNMQAAMVDAIATRK